MVDLNPTTSIIIKCKWSKYPIKGRWSDKKARPNYMQLTSVLFIDTLPQGQIIKTNKER